MLSKTFGCTRMIYNYYLDKRIKLYEKEKITFGYTKCANDLTILKKEKEFLKEVDSISLQQALRHLDTAFQNFFKNQKTGFPKFKSKKNNFTAKNRKSKDKTTQKYSRKLYLKICYGKSNTKRKVLCEHFV